MKIYNSYHPPVYRDQVGSLMYTMIDYVALYDDTVEISIQVPGSTDDSSIIKINDSTIISCLPSILNGEISCFHLLKELEHYLRLKHKKELSSYSAKSYWGSALQSYDERERLFGLWNMLLRKESLVNLCQWFPHEESNKEKFIQDTPLKVVSDEIIDAINDQFSLTCRKLTGKM